MFCLSNTLRQPFLSLNGNLGRRGFSLVELAVVLTVVGAIVAGIWSYSTLAQRKSSVTQSVQVINSIVDAVRVDYANRASISGGVSIVGPIIQPMGAFPEGLVHPTATICGGVSGNYVDSPFSNAASNDLCGTLRVCAWDPSAAGNTVCKHGTLPTNQQTFAVEFTYLDTASCIGLVTQITPSLPSPGLIDIFIDGSSGLTANGGSLPLTLGTAQNLCQNMSGLIPSTIDFIYMLRLPTS